MEEIFKDIPGYEGLYQVSDLGRVKSLERVRTDVYGKVYLHKERILKPGKSKGYLAVVLRRYKKPKSITVHKLVAMAFLNHKPCGLKLVVNHINLKKTDNRLKNLEIVTQRKNANRKHIKSSSKYVGVSFDKFNNKWKAQIQINGKTKNLGRFKYEIEAFDAYNSALDNINNEANKR